jgi:hypothetical protein
MIFIVIIVLILVAIRLIARQWRFGYVAGGVIYGLYNEICFEFCWKYSSLLAPMLWRDVPIVVILGWGLITGLALSLSDRMTTWLHWTNQGSRLLFDILCFTAIGFSVESIMPALHFWKYNFPIMADAWFKIMGYIFVGFLVSASGRMFQSFFDSAKRMNGTVQ